MGSIEKRGENRWRVGFRRSSAEGREWVRKTISFPATMSEDEQRRACEVELARLVVEDADARRGDAPAQPATSIQALITKYHISPADAAILHGAELPDGKWADNPITVRELYQKWMDLHCIPHLKHTTVKTYANLMLTRVLPAIGERRVVELTAMDMEQLLADIRKSGKRTTAIEPEARKRPQDRGKPLAPAKPLSDRTVQHYHDVISDMFDRGVAWELIPSNPMTKAVRPKARRKPLKVLDDAQAVELLRKLANEESLSFRSAVMLALVCGLRLSEVGALCWDDVDFDACTINVSRGLNYAPGHGNYVDTTKTIEGEPSLTCPRA